MDKHQDQLTHYLDSLMDDIFVMLSFLEKNGRALPSDLLAPLAELMARIRPNPQPNPQPNLQPATPPQPPAAQTSTLVPELLHLHGRLAALTTPATPQSIKNSQIANNTTLQFIIYAGFAGFLLFFASSANSMFALNFPAHIITEVGIVGAASLGIAFQSLYTASEYIKTSTFDDRYSQQYLINFILGLFSGIILGHFGKDIPGIDNTASDYQPLQQSILALIGGFSSEAVIQILQRTTDTLVTAVRGTGKDKFQAQADTQVTQNNSDVALQLSKTLTEHKDNPEALTQEIQKTIEELLKKQAK